MRHQALTVKFPGQPAVLRALREAGSWTPSDVFRWARANGGSAKTYAALAHYVDVGKLEHYAKDGDAPERWVYVTRYVPADSQMRGDAQW